MKVKDLKKLIQKLESSHRDADDWDVLVNVDSEFALLKPEAIYEGALWNIVIDCNYQPEPVEIEINSPSPTENSPISEEPRCPECLQKCTSAELEMFGGLCEDCFTDWD